MTKNEGRDYEKWGKNEEKVEKMMKKWRKKLENEEKTKKIRKWRKN